MSSFPWPTTAVADGTRADSITHTVTSSDGDYDELNPTMPVAITDDDGQPQVEILDVTQVETDGTTTFVFDVTVNPVSTNPITVTYSTAAAGVDPADPSEYESITNATLVIPALAAADTIEVEAYGDDDDEDAERFRVNATIVGGQLVENFALGTINDDDDTPVAVNDTYNVDEGATLNVGVPGSVLNDDTDGDSGTLTAMLGAAPTDHVGVFTLNANGSFTYQNDGDDGPDTFTYRASDGSNLSPLATVTINVANVAPTVSIVENPGSGPEGTQIDLTSTVSDPGNDTISRSWSVTKNGGAFDSGTGPGFSFTPDDQGTYVVTVVADDGDGGSGTDSITINVANVAPTVTINGNPGSGPEGTLIALTSTVSDPGDDVITRSWSVTKNGGAFDSGTGPGFSFTPDDNGTYAVTVTANDGEGGTDSDSVSINVTNVAPTVSINQDPGTGTEGTQIDLTASVSDPGSADTFTRSWSVTKNGGAFDTGTGFSYPFIPDDNGTYVVTVTADDDDGGSDSDSITINVTNVAPTVSIVENPGSGPEGTQIDLTSTVSDPGDDVISRSWSVTKNGGAFDSGSGPSFSFTPDDDGSYVVTVTANDGEGGSDTDSITITGTNVDPSVSINENPGSVPEGTLVALTSTASDPGDDVIARSWTVTKGGVPFANDTGPSFSFTPDDNATYVVTVVATDGDGGTGSDNITITGTNVDPTVTIVQDPGTGPEGTQIDLTSTVSDPGDDVITRSWSVTKNGGAFDSGNGPAFSFTPDDDGTYVVTITANDGDGGSGIDSITINVTNLDPTVAIVGAPASSPEGTQIDLTSTVSDPGDDVITRSWSVTKNGGAFDSGNGPAFSFTPDDNGTYVVTLVATDGDGGSDTDTATINVTNVDPTVTIVGAPASSPEGTQIDLTSTVSDPGDDVITRSWSVTKNGGAFDSGNGPAFSFTPDDNGTYVVTLVASDGEGGSDTDTATINVTNLNPTVTIVGAPASSPEGTQIDLTSTVSDPGTADVITRAWSVTKDGAPFDSGNGPAFSFTPDDNATYVVTLVATDDDAGSDTDTATVNVTNVGPTVSIDGPDPLSSPEGTEVSLTATVNDPGNDALTLTWTVTKDGAPFDAGTGTTFSFTPNDNATYVVTLDADDSEGGTDSDSMTVNATNVSPVVPPPAGDSIDEGGSFGLSAPFTDAGQAETHTAVVNWGDGTIEDCSVSPNCDLTQTDGLSGTVTGTHLYDDDGPWTVTVTVSDGIGSDPGATTVNVANVAPVVDTPIPDTIFEGDTYTFAGAFTDPGAGDTWSAEVNYDSGAGWQPLTLSGMTFALNNTYSNDSPAPRDVRVCVADDDQGPSPHLDGTCQSAAVETLNAAPIVTARDDADVDEGVTVVLTGATPTSFTDAGVLDTHTATIDWGEGAGPVAATVLPDDTVSGGHQYNVPGFYTVTVTVTDDAGDSDSDTFTVNVRNLNFEVNVSGPISRNEGGNLSISGDFTDSDGAGSYDLVVDWGDGSPPETISHTPTAAGEGTFSAGPHTYADDSDCVAAPGSCTLTVTVDDTADPQDDATNGYTVTVINKVPTTAIAGPTTSPEGTGFKLFGNPKDVFADTLTYEWTVTKDTGDGPAVFKTGTFKNIWFQPDDGCATCVYEATFVVTDDDGGVSDPEVWTVNVTNVKPDAQMLDEFGNTLPPVYDGGTEGTTVSLQAVFTDPGAADTHTITWEAKLLDQVIDTGNEPTFDFVAPDNGAYFVVLTVTDDDGGADTPGSPLITVSNAPPKITNLVTDPTPSVGTPVALNVFFTDAGVGDEHTVTVDWGDGSPIDSEADATSPTALSHTFAAGAHRAKICVADDDGAKKCKKIWYNAGAAPAGTGADFNGDGIEDMAVGVPGENSGAGAVNVFYGSSSGPSLTGDKFYRQGINGVLGTSEKGDEFGATLAYGDFNGDGYDDLAIGAPGEKLGGKNNSGSVNVLYGSASGLNANGDQLWTQDSNSVADSSQKGDRFADSLAVGDFNGDGFADLAIGVPGEDISGTSNAGRVQVLFGGPSKLVAGFSQSWHQGVKGVLDNKQGSDRYGSSLVAGDFDRDGFWDLAIGVPGQKVAGKSKAGAVAILPGSVLGLTAEDDQVWNQNKPGINDSAESGDQYGLALASGDFNADGFADLAVGIPLEGVGGFAAAGAVSVIYGTGTGLASDGDQFWNENSTDIYGAAEANNEFGFALAVGDAGNNGFDDLLVGIPNQAIGGDAEAGVVALIRGGGSGLAAVGNQRWHEDRSGTPGKAQPGDHFGAAIAFADVTGDGRDDLMAGIPGQSFTPTDVGAVMMVKGHSTGGFTSSGSKWYHQNMSGVAGDGSETNDQFGAAL